MDAIKLQPYYQRSCALVIGINQYRHINPLSRACLDAQSVTEVLTSDLGFPKESVVTLLDGQATRAEMMKCFFSFDSTSVDDRLLVFFAGHGDTVWPAWRRWLPCSG